jgi:hypothetical protein
MYSISALLYNGGRVIINNAKAALMPEVEGGEDPSELKKMCLDYCGGVVLWLTIDTSTWAS